MTEPCEHKSVTTYSRMVAMQTLYEPAEYECKTVCSECGDELDEVPDGSSEKLEEWEDIDE